jgi:hypothetical protein
MAARSAPAEDATARAASTAHAAPQLAASHVPDVRGVPLSNENKPTRAAKWVGVTSWRNPRTGHTDGSTSTSALHGSRAVHSFQALARNST